MIPPRDHRLRALAGVAAVVWAALVAGLGSVSDPPGAELAPDLPLVDKLAHAGLYAVLAVLLRLSGLRPSIAVLLAATWGVLDELHQRTVPGRDADPWDALADLAGAYLGVVAVGWSARRRGASR